MRPVLTDGEIASVVSRLWHPRQTAYQSFCLHLGQLVLDLPISRFHAWYRGPGTLVRHCPRVTNDGTLVEWAITVLEENLLAGVVLIDALDWFCRAVEAVMNDSGLRFPSPQDKKQLTEAAGHYLIDFEVPVGWEFVLGDASHGAGFRGIAFVERCHLSENWYQGEHGYGQLIGLTGLHVEDAIGFDIPCQYHPELRVEGEALQTTGAERLYGIGLRIPYAFMRRAFRRPWAATDQLTFTSRPTNEEVYQCAKGAADRLRERALQEPPYTRDRS